VLTGVCGGLGEYFNIDPVVFRIVFVLLAIPGGLPSVLPYLLMWIVMPEAPPA
jgi:phage shock protein C